MNLADRGELLGFLRKYGLSADKSLGQHFLCSPKVVSAIVEAAKPSAGCLEIGPGPGILTSFLAKANERMVAIEFDARMVSVLAHSAPSCEVLEGDALKTDLTPILDSLPEPRALVSNMPYYITGPLLEAFSQVRTKFDRAVLMMQKEVGIKLLAKPHERERGSLSVMLQSQFTITHVINAPADAFMPPPKVDSVVLCLTPRIVDLPNHFARVVRAGFTQNRKTLINNLSATFRVGKDQVQHVLTDLGHPMTKRAFELSESDWIQIASHTMVVEWIESLQSQSSKKPSK